VTIIKENFINFIVDIYNMGGEYTNLDKRLQEQNLRHGKEKPPELTKLIVEQDPCKIPGYICIPEREYRRRDSTYPMPIVEPDPNNKNDGIYKILPIPINPEDKPKQGEYHLLPIMESNQNKNPGEGYVWILEETVLIPERGQIMVPREYIHTRIPGEMVYIPGLGYGFIPYKYTLKP
jgi:hypothetical protein